VESPRGSPKGVVEGFLLRGATILEPYITNMNAPKWSKEYVNYTRPPLGYTVDMLRLSLSLWRPVYNQTLSPYNAGFIGFNTNNELLHAFSSQRDN